MNHPPTPRRLIILSLIVVLVSTFFSISPTSAASTANALILMPHKESDTSGRLIFAEAVARMNAGAATTIVAEWYTGFSTPIFQYGKLAFAAGGSPGYFKVVDARTGLQRTYPQYPVSRDELVSAPIIFINQGRQLLFGTTAVWHLLDLASGRYTSVPGVDAGHSAIFGQSPADGMIYVDGYCKCFGGSGRITRTDFKGNQQDVTPNLGMYVRASDATLSPAGKYLYFLARDSDQPAPSRKGVFGNVIMRYRISDGIASVIARAEAGNFIVKYTLLSDDPYITYVEAPVPDNFDTGAGTVTNWLIRRVNLATHSAPEQLLITDFVPESMAWCGNTFFYDEYKFYGEDSDSNKYIVHSYSPATHEAAQADGRLVGCAP